MLIQHNVSVSPFTTFKTGGSARFFVTAKNLEDVVEAIKFANEQSVKIIPLGSGSNMLFLDGALNILVLKNEILGKKVKLEDDREVELLVGAGENWDDTVKYSVDRGWYGLENLSWIPGTVGASPVQNIGAYGAEVSEVIVGVQAVNLTTGEVKEFSKSDCQFSYRDSIFKREPWFIVSVTFSLVKNGRVNIGYKDIKEFFKERYSSSVTLSELRDAVISIRKNKLPDIGTYGTAGSFFKNPIIGLDEYQLLKEKYPDMPGFQSEDKVKIPLAWILDKVLNLNGYKVGPVGLYQTQPLAVVNYGGATTAQVLDFAQNIAHLVREKTGILIEKEVVVIGG